MEAMADNKDPSARRRSEDHEQEDPHRLSCNNHQDASIESLVRSAKGNVIQSGVGLRQPPDVSEEKNQAEPSGDLEQRLPPDDTRGGNAFGDVLNVSQQKKHCDVRSVLAFNAEYLVSASAGVVLGRFAVEHFYPEVISPGASLFLGDTLGFYGANILLRSLEKAKQYRSDHQSFLKDIYKLAVIGAVSGVAATACRIGITNYLTQQGWDYVSSADVAQIPAQIISLTGFNIGWFYGDRITTSLKNCMKDIASFVSNIVQRRPHV